MENSENSQPHWRKFISEKSVTFVIWIAYGIFIVFRILGIYNKDIFGMLILISFVLMAIFPFIFMVKDGRKAIGLRKATLPKWYLISTLGGVLMAFIIFLIGFGYFGTTADNWYISIINQVMTETERLEFSTPILFIIVTLPSIIFSPIGEEIFFRGVVMQYYNVDKGNSKWRILFGVIPFAVIHILHHGIFIVAGDYNWQFLSGLVWFLLMMGVSFFFAWIKKSSSSLYPAILGHSIFNLVMNITIFLFLI